MGTHNANMNIFITSFVFLLIFGYPIFGDALYSIIGFLIFIGVIGFFINIIYQGFSDPPASFNMRWPRNQ
jgi:hypothetical protein